MTHHEVQAVAAALDEVAPSAPTACAGWTAHEIVAHFTAGSKETADLIEEKLAGRPPRATRTFEEREPPFRALGDGELRAAWKYQVRRKTEALDALAGLGENVAVDFTGTTMTAARFLTHSRSEAAIHRWDIVGSDAISDEVLAQPELTAHAVDLLNDMPILSESARARMALAPFPLRIVLRAPPRPDIVLAADVDGHPRFQLCSNDPADGDAVVITDPAQRLLVLWGRRSSTRPVTIDAETRIATAVASVLWPDAIPWP